MKSTTVRFIVRAGLRLAPARVDLFAARAFLTPRRPRRPELPASAKLGPGTRGLLRLPAGEVTFWSWGQGPAVLLVHGWEGRAAQLVPMAEAVVRAGRRAVAVDLPAHGASAGQRTHLLAFVRAIRELARVVGPLEGIIAHSLGGAAATLAQLEGAGAARLVALAPAAEPELFVNHVVRWLGIPDARRESVYRQVEALVGRPFEEVDLRRAEGRLHTPLLVLHDPRDSMVPFAHGEAVAKVSTQGELQRVREVGHWRVLTHPEVISRAVAFITGAEPRRLLAAGQAGAPAGGRLGWENRSGSA